MIALNVGVERCCYSRQNSRLHCYSDNSASG